MLEYSDDGGGKQSQQKWYGDGCTDIWRPTLGADHSQQWYGDGCADIWRPTLGEDISQQMYGDCYASVIGLPDERAPGNPQATHRQPTGNPRATHGLATLG